MISLSFLCRMRWMIRVVLCSLVFATSYKNINNATINQNGVTNIKPLIIPADALFSFLITVISSFDLCT